MSTIEHTQSLNDFRRLLGETLDRVNQTGDAEIIVDQGEAREVLLSPAVYDAMRDAAAIQRSRQDIAEGKVHSIDLVSAHIRAGLLARKSQSDGAK